MNKRFSFFVLLAVVASLVLAACGAATPAPLSAEEQAALIANAVDKAVQTAMAKETKTPMPSSTPSNEDLMNGVLQAAQTAAPLTCITTAQAKETLGLDVQRLEKEPCAWVARNPLQTGFSVKAPVGWELTVTVKEAAEKFVVYIFYGEGGLVLDNVTAVTARKLSGYDSNDAVHVPCQLFKKEQDFGAKEVNSFPVYAGNFTCGE